MRLLAHWLDPQLHSASIYHNRYDLFPNIPNAPEYWRKLSQIWIFQDKTPAELQCRTRSLLFRLIWVSAEKYLGEYPILRGNYSPLQNICLVMEAFGVGPSINQYPVSAFKPLSRTRMTTENTIRAYFPDLSSQPLEDNEVCPGWLSSQLAVGRPEAKLVTTLALPRSTVDLPSNRFSDHPTGFLRQTRRSKRKLSFMCKWTVSI